MIYNKQEVRTGLTASKKNEIIRAAGHICEIPTCEHEAYEVHHIVAVRHGGQNTEENLVALCSNCHTRFERGIEDVELLRNIVNNRSTDHKRRINAQFRDMKPPKSMLNSKKTNEIDAVEKKTPKTVHVPDEADESSKTAKPKSKKPVIASTKKSNNKIFYPILIDKKIRSALNKLIKEDKLYFDEDNQYKMRCNDERISYDIFNDFERFENLIWYIPYLEDIQLRIIQCIQKGVDSKSAISREVSSTYGKEYLDALVRHGRIALENNKYVLINNGIRKKDYFVNPNTKSLINAEFHNVLISKEVQSIIDKLIEEDLIYVDEDNQYARRDDDCLLSPYDFSDVENMEYLEYEILDFEEKRHKIIECARDGLNTKKAICERIGEKTMTNQYIDILVDKGELEIIKRRYVLPNAKIR